MSLVAKGALLAGVGALASSLLTSLLFHLLPPLGGGDGAFASWTVTAAAGLLVGLAAAGAFTWLAHRALRPLAQLLDAAGASSRGCAPHPGLPVLQNRPDEVGALACAIHEMQQRLEHRNAALTQAYVTVMESERRLADIIDHLIEGFLVVQADGTIQRANPAAGRVFGCRSDELTGRQVADLGWQTDEIEQARLACDRGEQTLLTARNAAGAEVPVEVGVTRVEQDGRVLYCVLVRDLTVRLRMEHEVRQSRTFLNRVVELMPVAVFLKDASTMRFTMVNQAMEKLAGNSAQHFIGRRYSNFPLLKPGLAAEFNRIECQLAAGQIPVHTMQYVLPTPSGERTVRATSVGLRDESGAVTHLLGVVEDLSDQIAVQHELQTQKQRAEAANRAKSEFLANMSHELRTPLNAIIGYSEMLDEVAREQQRLQESEDLRRIVGAGRHLLTLINAILDLAKSDSGRTEVCCEPVDIDRLITDVSTVAAPLIRHNGNTFEITGTSTGTCASDESLLRSILTNLLGNAAKFTRRGTVSLCYDVGPHGATFRIRDTGIGIPRDVQALIFQPFVQADTSSSREFGGTGLGLTLCRRYCEQLGGEIHLESEPGAGSTFTLHVPNAARQASCGRNRPLPASTMPADKDTTAADNDNAQ